MGLVGAHKTELNRASKKKKKYLVCIPTPHDLLLAINTICQKENLKGTQTSYLKGRVVMVYLGEEKSWTSQSPVPPCALFRILISAYRSFINLPELGASCLADSKIKKKDP